MPETGTFSEYIPLLKLATPSLYRGNAFRITGLDVDSTSAQISRHIQKIEMAERLGVEGSSQLFGIFPPDPRPSLAAVRDAKRRLDDPEARLLDEFFWFWPAEDTDSGADPALQALRRNDIHSAHKIWEQSLRCSNDPCPIHNLAILNHLQALEHQLSPIILATKIEAPVDGQALWAEAAANWNRLSHEPKFWERFQKRIREFDDPRLTVAIADRIRSSLPAAMANIDALLAISAAQADNFNSASVHLRRIKERDLPEEQGRRLLEKGLHSVVTRLGHICKNAESEVERTPDRTPEILATLVQETKPFREVLNYLLGGGNSVRDAAHDDIANAIRKCLPQYGNKTKNYQACHDLLKEASHFAASAYVRSQCKADLDTVNELLADAVMELLAGICKDAETFVTAQPRTAERTIRKLLADSDVLFHQLHEVTTSRSELRVLAYDYVARSARGCIIDFANETNNWTACVGLLEQCRSLASSGEVVKRIEEDLKTVHANLTQQTASVNYTTRPVAPGYPYTSQTPSPTLPTKGGTGKILAFVAAAIIFCIILARACDDSSTTNGLTARPPSTSGTSVDSSTSTTEPESRTAAEGTGANKTPSTGGGARGIAPRLESTYQSGRQDGIEDLKLKIDNAQPELRRFESSLHECDRALSYYSDLIDQDRRQLERLKADNDSGLEVDHNEYERVLQRHNSNVELHNSELGTCRQVSTNYKQLLNETNANIDLYNRMIR
jgi:hypothetical protein